MTLSNYFQLLSEIAPGIKTRADEYLAERLGSAIGFNEHKLIVNAYLELAIAHGKEVGLTQSDLAGMLLSSAPETSTETEALA